jgi:hypothetical protein
MENYHRMRLLTGLGQEGRVWSVATAAQCLGGAASMSSLFEDDDDGERTCCAGGHSPPQARAPLAVTPPRPGT